MSAQAGNPAGAIRVRLHTRDGAVVRAQLSSSRRTDFSRRLFAGRPLDHLLSTLPMVFSVCATAQASAAVQAVECAAGITPDPRHVAARELLVLTETAREHLFRILLGWSDWLQTPLVAPGLGTLGRMRVAWGKALYPGGGAFRPGGATLKPSTVTLKGLVDDLDGLLHSALGDADAWPAVSGTDDLRRWAETGEAVAPRMLAAVLAGEHAALGGSAVDALPNLDPDTLAAQLGGADADAFVAAPQWGGVACETGALPRTAANPLIAALHTAYGNGLLTRLAARLSELLAVVARIRELIAHVEATPAGSSVTAIDGSGVAQVEAARGRLAHWVRLQGGVVADYCILAPTEWNFHPQGVLAQGLLTLPADERLPRLARLLVDAIDPCVESHVEVQADA